LKKAEERRHSYYFAIRLSEGGDLIGFTCIVWVLHTHQTARFFIDFNKEENLLAHGDETLKLMLRYAFMEVSLHRLATVVSTYETSLILLLERFGFLREVQRREAVFHDGQYFDELDYALLKPEYKKTIEEETK